MSKVLSTIFTLETAVKYILRIIGVDEYIFLHFNVSLLCMFRFWIGNYIMQVIHYFHTSHLHFICYKMQLQRCVLNFVHFFSLYYIPISVSDFITLIVPALMNLITNWTFILKMQDSSTIIKSNFQRTLL